MASSAGATAAATVALQRLEFAVYRVSEFECADPWFQKSLKSSYEELNTSTKLNVFSSIQSKEPAL